MAKKLDNNIALKNYELGYDMVLNHPIFEGFLKYYRVSIYRNDTVPYPKEGYAVCSNLCCIYVNPKIRANPSEWAYILAHCLLHFALEHFKGIENKDIVKWNIACDVAIAKFLENLKFGTPINECGARSKLIFMSSEEQIYKYLLENEVDEKYKDFQVGNKNSLDMIIEKVSSYNKKTIEKRMKVCPKIFAEGLSKAVSSAIDVAAGYASDLYGSSIIKTKAKRALEWFVSSYPLLGALASSFKLIEDPLICQREEISIAAIDVTLKEIYINSSANLSMEECKFVIAHELLHAGLMHHERCCGRDVFLWNVACDFVINGWLIEMEIGEIPTIGLLYDESLKGLSAESIYDKIVTDIRTYRKLITLRGKSLGDIIKSPNLNGKVGENLEDFYKSALQQGLEYHKESGRGFLPKGLVEEIKALSMPAIPWDVELAKWFDNFLNPIEKRRTYGRPSRRQSSTPDIPRPSYIYKPEEYSRTFGVVLDTSGSMDRHLLAKALGAITSYSISRDVVSVRVVFCDAVAYDEGYLNPEELLDRVKVKGRGGTILQPGINLLEKAEDFPKDGPILIITDGECDKVTIKREHAFLIPKGKHLPFVPKGKVFRFN